MSWFSMVYRTMSLFSLISGSIYLFISTTSNFKFCHSDWFSSWAWRNSYWYFYFKHRNSFFFGTINFQLEKLYSSANMRCDVFFIFIFPIGATGLIIIFILILFYAVLLTLSEFHSTLHLHFLPSAYIHGYTVNSKNTASSFTRFFVLFHAVQNPTKVFPCYHLLLTIREATFFFSIHSIVQLFALPNSAELTIKYKL